MRFVVILHGLPIFRFEARNENAAWRILFDVVPIPHWEHCALCRVTKESKR